MLVMEKDNVIFTKQVRDGYSVIESELQMKIINLRGYDVLADADVAHLYGVETKRINEAVRNNPDKFPADYIFTLTSEELHYLRSKISTTTVSMKSRDSTKAFTEKGLYMLATILRSKRATDVTFAIIETFAKVRNLKRDIAALHTDGISKPLSARMQIIGETISDIIMPDLETSETESTLELNFLIGKITHTVKRIKKK